MKNPCVDPRCPNYVSKESNIYCSFCGEGILDGDEYIKNLNGECRHYDCFYNTRDLLGWIGFEIETMEQKYE